MTGEHVREPGRGGWQTPDPLYDGLDARYVFDYDPAADHDNARTALYSTRDGTFCREPSGYVWRVSPQTGLDTDWTGLRVYCNPPYTRGELGPWAGKCASEASRAAIVIGLFPSDHSTGWWQRYVEGRVHHDPLPKRVRFVHADYPCGATCRHELGAPLGGAPGPNSVLEWRTDYGRFL